MDRRTIFANRIKQYRKEFNYSVEDVCDRLNDMGIAVKPKTIYAWESGTNQPQVDALMCLAHIYKLNSVLDSFGYPVNSSDSSLFTESVNKEELELLKAFRTHPEFKDKVFKIYDIDIL